MNKIKLNKKFYKEDCDYPDIQQFRIYDPREEKFYYSGGTPTMIADFFKFTASLHTYYGMPYQRMTGLKDKSKKDIYEGDIFSNEGFGKVVWSKISCAFFVESKNNKNTINHVIQYFSVLGNIHENKDLIKMGEQG